MKKKEKIIGTMVLLGLVMLILVGVLQSRNPTNLSENEISEIFSDKGNGNSSDPNIIDLSENNNKNSEDDKSESEKITVEIKGEVNKPDVYELKSGSRINDLIIASGGVTEKAILDNINRATILSDGDCIIVGNIDNKNNNSLIESESKESSDPSDKNNGGKININIADKTMLMTLTGVGEVKADSILSYREKNGKFTSVEQLAEVDGIGAKTVEKLKEKITIK